MPYSQRNIKFLEGKFWSYACILTSNIVRLNTSYVKPLFYVDKLDMIDALEANIHMIPIAAKSDRNSGQSLGIYSNQQQR